MSSTAKADRAAELYEQFTGHDAKKITKFAINWPTHGLQVGFVDGIMYETVRDGVKEHYIHKFKKSARPIFGVSYDGKMLLPIGGKFRFTDRGIVDD